MASIAGGSCAARQRPVGDPADILPPDRHEAIWERQKPLDFPGFVYGVDRDAPDTMVEVTERLSASLSRHGEDRVVG